MDFINSQPTRISGYRVGYRWHSKTESLAGSSHHFKTDKEAKEWWERMKVVSNVSDAVLIEETTTLTPIKKLI